jgi:hypothetical protein
MVQLVNNNPIFLDKSGIYEKTGGVKMSEFDLSGYTPEAPSAGGFEPFKFDGVATIVKSVISKNEGKDTEYYPAGCLMIEIEAIVAEGQHKGQHLFKRFNLDDQKADKKGKTKLHKLRDQFHAAGLSFNNFAELTDVNEEFVNKAVLVKCWVGKFKAKEGEEPRDPSQLWNIQGVAPDGWEDALHLEEPATADASAF